MRSAFAVVAALVVASLNPACINGTPETLTGEWDEDRAGTQPVASGELRLYCDEVTEPLPTEGAALSVFLRSEHRVVATRCGSVDTIEVPLSSGQRVPLVDDFTSDDGRTLDLGVNREGDELVFALTIRDSRKTFYSGEASRNKDGAVHARVLQRVDGLYLVGFETGDDNDFNDLVILMSGDLVIR